MSYFGPWSVDSILVALRSAELEWDAASTARERGEPDLAYGHLCVAHLLMRSAGLIAETIIDRGRRTAQQQGEERAEADEPESGHEEELAQMGTTEGQRRVYRPLHDGPWSGWSAPCEDTTVRLWLAKHGPRIVLTETPAATTHIDTPADCALLGYYERRSDEMVMHWRPWRLPTAVTKGPPT